MNSEATNAQNVDSTNGEPSPSRANLLGPRRAPPASASEPAVKILLVDDREDKLLALESVLSELDLCLVKARSGREALRHLLQQEFAVILLDVSMPGMDGFETASLIRTRAQSEHTPIIFVTSLSSSEHDIARGYALGAVDYVLSPIVPHVLKTKVSVFIELYKKTEQIKRQARRLLEIEEMEHRQQVATLLDALPDLIFLVDSNGKIEFRNTAAEAFARAAGIDDCLPAPLQAQVERAFKTRQSYLPTNFEGVERFLIGTTERHLLSRIVVMPGVEDRILGVAVMLQDVTEFRLLDEVKSNVLATVSHELKTPLTSLRPALLMLKEQQIGPLNGPQLELITIACEESERLLRTLNNLLDLTRFEDGLPGMFFEEVAPRALLEAAVEQTRGQTLSAHLTVQVNVEGDLPTVLVDRERILHVLTNFLTNAIKHSPEGGDIVVRGSRDSTTRVRFSVSDRGPGVPEEYQHRIFEKFFRVPGNRRSGIGLGLTIAREFIKAHRGTIGVLSAPPAGSDFYFVLPSSSSLPIDRL